MAENILGGIFSIGDRAKKRVRALLTRPEDFGAMLNADAADIKAALDSGDPERYLDYFGPGALVGQAAKVAKAGARSLKTEAKTEALRGGAVDAPRAVTVGKRFKSGQNEGVYRGTESFGGITPQKLGQLRRGYMDSVEEGADLGANWYENASRTILNLVDRDPMRADKLADALAITSSRTPVDTNLMFAAKGVNQAALGEPVRTGGFPNNMGPRIENAWAQEDAGAGLGLKRSPYRAGLSVEWRGPESVKRATHDIHDVRAWGITDPITGEPWSKGVPDAGHRFLDEQADWAVNEANRRGIGGRTDWKHHNTQAAAWIAQKAKTSGMPLEEAAADYTQFVPKYSAQITREWPTSVPEHLPELLDQPYDVRRAFSDDLEQVLRNSAGGDRFVTETGGLSAPTLPNRGFYEGQEGPGYASQVLVGKETGENAIDDASRRYVEAIAAGEGILGTQKQMAYNFNAGPSPIKRAGLYDVDMGRPATEDELRALQSAVPDADIPMVQPRGARVLEFADEGDPSRQARVNALRGLGMGDVTPGARSGDIFPVDANYNAPESFSYGPYLDKIEAAGPVFGAKADAFAQQAAPQVLAKTQAWAQKLGLTQAPWFETAMKALQEGGFTKLRELQKAGVVPAAFVAIVAAAEDEEQF